MFAYYYENQPLAWVGGQQKEEENVGVEVD